MNKLTVSSYRYLITNYDEFQFIYYSCKRKILKEFINDIINNLSFQLLCIEIINLSSFHIIRITVCMGFLEHIFILINPK